MQIYMTPNSLRRYISRKPPKKKGYKGYVNDSLSISSEMR